MFPQSPPMHTNTISRASLLLLGVSKWALPWKREATLMRVRHALCSPNGVRGIVLGGLQSRPRGV